MAQLSQGLQTALGNAQTVVAFRISRADAEAMARVLGEVDPQTIKHHNQLDTQHPLFSPLSEQWEGFIQHLTRQQVRQATVKTADDRVATIWPEKVPDHTCSDEAFEAALVTNLKRHGRSFDTVHHELVQRPAVVKPASLYAP